MTAPEQRLELAAGRAVVAVRLGAAEFGLPISEVREVLRTPPLTRVPFALPGVTGATSVRGAVVPVIDLGVRLNRAPAERPGTLVVVVAGEPREPLGLLVDAVTGIADAAESELREPPAEAEATLPVGWVYSVLLPEPDRPITVLQLAAVLARHRAVDLPRARSSNPLPDPG